ncbi:NAD(P)H-quinone oxidoreductase [Pontibacter sp. G13]|uniref:NAD(P)H-quinone oxidoreductase n=1 Tax=Pontibacter sp. G13 TaxID=3074898 RepID=UPI00288BA31D|nr:NAD(P)H-quinone oxidoreductase [Pontibacter sp. G13]WNJ20239.1 NAD(P)H-quinone oxidoreductase [Pontibacter sp. G13]
MNGLLERIKSPEPYSHAGKMATTNGFPMNIPSTMRAVLFDRPCDADGLYIGEFPTPQPTSQEILVKVTASALNRADILQRKGQYPPPPGASKILGLEMAGEVVQVGPEVTKWKVGDQVCGLLAGGGQAEYAVIQEDIAMPIPPGLSVEAAAAIPEVFMTAFHALDWKAELQKGEDILIHAGASGVGTAAIQIARAMGARVLVTASAGKHDYCRSLGATLAIDYKTEQFEQVVRKFTHGQGVHVILDFIAAAYFQQNINTLSMDGRMVMLALMGGIKMEKLSLINIVSRRLSIMGSTLRNQSRTYKAQLSQSFQNFAWPLFEADKLKPVIDQILPLDAVSDAHRLIESNQTIGKIVLRISD